MMRACCCDGSGAVVGGGGQKGREEGGREFAIFIRLSKQQMIQVPSAARTAQACATPDGLFSRCSDKHKTQCNA